MSPTTHAVSFNPPFPAAEQLLLKIHGKMLKLARGILLICRQNVSSLIKRTRDISDTWI